MWIRVKRARRVRWNYVASIQLEYSNRNRNINFIQLIIFVTFVLLGEYILYVLHWAAATLPVLPSSGKFCICSFFMQNIVEDTLIWQQ